MIEPQPPGFEYGMTVRVKSDAPVHLRPGAVGSAVSFETVRIEWAHNRDWPVGTLLYLVEYTDGEAQLMPASMTVREPEEPAG